MLDEKIEKFFTVGKSQNKFTISKCHINTIDRIISNKGFLSISNFPWLTILLIHQVKPFRIFDQFRGLLNKSYNR